MTSGHQHQQQMQPPQETNLYQTHIVTTLPRDRIHPQQGCDDDISSHQPMQGASGGIARNRLLRLESNDSDYENSIASYGKLLLEETVLLFEIYIPFI